MEKVTAEFEKVIRDFYQAVEEKDGGSIDRFLDPQIQVLSEHTVEWFRERPKILQLIAEEVASAESYKNWIEAVVVTPLAEDVVVATYDWHGEARWGGKSFSVRCPSSMVLRRTSNTWRIALIHSVPVQVPEGEPGSAM